LTASEKIELGKTGRRTNVRDALIHRLTEQAISEAVVVAETLQVSEDE